MRRRLLGAMLALVCLPGFGQVAHPQVAGEEGDGTPGMYNFRVELSSDVRRFIGRGQESAISHALVRVVTPPRFDQSKSYPLLVVSATAVRGHSSSRKLLDAYADAAAAQGWVLVAADPDGAPEGTDEHTTERFALNTVALGILEQHWAWAAQAPIAFAGFSGGAKYSAMLAAAFAAQGRMPVGVYLSGLNEPTLNEAAHAFKVRTEQFKQLKVFFASGDEDEIATPGNHRDVLEATRNGGFHRTRLETYHGRHVPDASLLPAALRWFLARD
ncbi:hypothetical protein [Massilia sp. TS11]|uniref:hypothetical protein n=1 Tax=Massilia sp. TS11 TaxID=2908003 RepID=UPI001EDC2FA3|nr:hypothetical protein [Massilia sp. TS11]MCG2583016.1 hypothetical protein [Massilia sp. TS11]